MSLNVDQSRDLKDYRSFLFAFFPSLTCNPISVEDGYNFFVCGSRLHPQGTSDQPTAPVKIKKTKQTPSG